MFKEQRRREISRIVKDSESVTVGKLAQYFKTSVFTIRRDLDVLSEQNLIERTHGGAINRNGHLTKELSFDEKDTKKVQEKKIISKTAVKQIHHSSSIFMDGGTTNLRVARELRKSRKNIEVITNSLKIAMELTDEMKVLLLGGNIRPTSFDTVGPLVLSELDNFYADKFILGIDGIDIRSGLTTIELNQAAVKSKMISRSRETIVVADSSKVGRVACFKVGPITAVKKIISDKNLSMKHRKEIEKAGVEVICC